MIRRNLAWILFGLSLVLNIFFIGGFVYAKHYGPPWAPGHAPWQQRVDAKWAEELRLDDAQQRTFREAFRAMRQRNAGRVRGLAVASHLFLPSCPLAMIVSRIARDLQSHSTAKKFSGRAGTPRTHR